MGLEATWLLLITEALPSNITHCPRDGLGTVCFIEEWGCALCCSRRERLQENSFQYKFLIELSEGSIDCLVKQ